MASARVRSSSSARLAEVLGVAVGRAARHERHVAGRQRGVADLEVVDDVPPGELHGAVVAVQLVDGVGEDARVGLQPLELAAVAEQAQDPVADQPGGGLVAGDVEQGDVVEELLHRQRALVGGDEEVAEEVVGEVVALPRDDLGEDVAVDRLVGGDRLGELLTR